MLINAVFYEIQRFLLALEILPSHASKIRVVIIVKNDPSQFSFLLLCGSKTQPCGSKSQACPGRTHVGWLTML